MVLYGFLEISKTKIGFAKIRVPLIAVVVIFFSLGFAISARLKKVKHTYCDFFFLLISFLFMYDNEEDVIYRFSHC